MFENLEQDYQRHSKQPGNLWRYLYKAAAHDGFRAVLLYRLGVWFKQHNISFLASMCQRLMHHLCHCWISVSAEIGSGFLIAHVGAIGIGGGTQIGKNCDVRRNCSIGGNFSKVDEHGRSKPRIGDNVSIGVNAVITGPVRVGSNSIIGANSVVNRDVPENVIVFGVPAKIIGERWNPGMKRGP
ncbi:MAG: DapH/DapD/GlmU-related protein [Anaerolineales bacterium]